MRKMLTGASYAGLRAAKDPLRRFRSPLLALLLRKLAVVLGAETL